MLHVGLTGGIASGKSTAAAILSELGGVVIDADRIARDVVELGTPGLAAVKAAFGHAVLKPDGSLDRQRLAGVVFDDSEALAQLNAIVHPLVRQETAARIEQLPHDAVVINDVPLIVENNMAAQYHLVIVVGASEELRIERAVARGLTHSEARSRIAAQADDAARRRAADAWVDNEGTAEQLRSAIEVLWRARVVPFAENLAAGRPAEPGERSGRVPAGADAAVDRIIARIERAGRGLLHDLRAVRRSDDTSLDIIEVRARSNAEPGADAFEGAGFVQMRPGVFGSADPGCPAVLEVEYGGAPQAERGA